MSYRHNFLVFFFLFVSLLYFTRTVWIFFKLLFPHGLHITALIVVVAVVLLFYVHGKHLWPCRLT